MILDLTPDNLKILNIEGFDFSQSTNDIIRNETIYACNIEKKIYTDIDCKRKMYLNIDFKGEKINSFPATESKLFKEYFDLELNKFLELQKSLLPDSFNEVSQRKRFVKNQINLYTDKLEKNKTKLKNRPDAMRDVCDPIELYIMFCEDYEQGQYEAKKPDEVKNEIFVFKKNNFDDVTPKKVIEHFKILHENGYISKENFELFIKTRFEDNKNLIEKIELLKENSRVQFKSIFYKYYDTVINQKYGKKPQYVKLLCENFTGFEYDAISTNFSD